MSEKVRPTHTMPGGAQEENSKADDGVVNDSLGTIDTADTTGLGEDQEACEPRDQKAGQAGRRESTPRRSGDK